MLGTILIILLILLLIGALPRWGYSSELGLRPVGNPRADPDRHRDPGACSAGI